MASNTYKSSDGKTTTVLKGSKAEKSLLSSGATLANAKETRQAKDISKANTYARMASDPLTVAENMGAKIPEKIKPEEMQGVVGSLEKQLGTNLPPAQVQTPGAVNTTQPSPSTVNATQGLPGSPAPSPYQQAFQNNPNAVANTNVPMNFAQAYPSVQSTLPQQQEDMSLVDTALSEDKGFQNLLTQYNDIFSPEQQKSSLMDTYNKQYKKLGLEQLDEDIIDAKTIIEGTEDDIRNEIEQAGGFGTDSQVQALALSRNKQLLKNYNNLVSLRESKANQLDTMMNFADKDRNYASQQLDRAINFQNLIMNYRDKFIQNARDQYNKYDPGQLYAMLQDNPRQLAFAEEIMGVGPGGLQKLAAYKAPLSEIELLQLENQRLQNQKLRQDLNPTGSNINLARQQGAIQETQGLTTNKGLTAATGPNFLSRAPSNLGGLLTRAGTGVAIGAGVGSVVPFIGTLAGALIGGLAGGLTGARKTLTGEKANFIAGVEQLRSNLNLDTLINAKARGATFGALSDQELQVLASAGSKIGTWAIKDKRGNVVGYNASEKDLQKELDRINYYAKLDYLLKQGNPEDVGVIQMEDGTFWTQNTDGTYSQLQ